jgi:hypothetical protein
MRESRSYGSVRGALSDERAYRELVGLRWLVEIADGAPSLTRLGILIGHWHSG